MSQPLRLAVFDVDGTLVDSQHHINASMQLAYGAMGLDAPTLEQVRGIVGLSLPQAMQQLTPDLSGLQNDALVAAYKATFKSKREGGEFAPLYDGINTVLDWLEDDDHLLLGLATGNSRRGLDAVVEGHGLASKFITSQVADDHPSKPHPSMLLAALSETGVEAENALMIGDTTFDMEMGVAAGMRCIGVSWGYHTDDRLRDAGATWIVNEAAELIGLFEEIWG